MQPPPPLNPNGGKKGWGGGLGNAYARLAMASKALCASKMRQRSRQLACRLARRPTELEGSVDVRSVRADASPRSSSPPPEGARGKKKVRRRPVRASPHPSTRVKHMLRPMQGLTPQLPPNPPDSTMGDPPHTPKHPLQKAPLPPNSFRCHITRGVWGLPTVPRAKQQKLSAGH